MLKKGKNKINYEITQLNIDTVENKVKHILNLENITFKEINIVACINLTPVLKPLVPHAYDRHVVCCRDVGEILSSTVHY